MREPGAEGFSHFRVHGNRMFLGSSPTRPQARCAEDASGGGGGTPSVGLPGLACCPVGARLPPGGG